MSDLESFLPLAMSMIALSVSILTFILTRFFQSQDRKRALTIAMWQRWDEPPIRDQRVVLWKAMEQMTVEPERTGSTISFRKLESQSLRALNDVEQFLDGLGKLRMSKQLDDQLFRSLFYPNIEQWRILSVSVDREEGDQVRSNQRMKELYARLE